LAHSWVPGKKIRAEKKGWKMVGGDADAGRVAVPR
jgi:hypothetical protein